METDEQKLIFLLVHGIGPQDQTLHDRFLDAVKDSAREHLGEGSAGLLSRLVTLRADWNRLFEQEGRQWLNTLFPKHDDPMVTRNRKWRLSRLILTILLFTGLAPALVAYLYKPFIRPVLATLPLLRVNLLSYAAAWLLGVILTGLVLWLAWRWYIGYRLPWGDVWSFGRRFEADSLSDVILYQSDWPRREIVQKVLDELQPYLPDMSAAERPPGERLPIVLAGHSLGSVVVYDLLLGAAAARRGRETAASRELAMLDGGERCEDRREFLQLVRRAHRGLRVVGMATFGAPIALFLFRKPALLKRRDLWREACPPEFEETGTSGDLKWMWPNFWHTADFVAHRLGPLFNDGFPLNGAKEVPARPFVEDVRVRRPVQHPIAAHSQYWDDPVVIERIGSQLADCLKALWGGSAGGTETG